MNKTSIRFIELGDVSTELAHNLTISLGVLQNVFTFTLDGTVIKLDPKKTVKGVYTDAYIWSLVKKHLSQKANTGSEYPIAICHEPLEEGVFSSADVHGAIVSTYGIREILDTGFGVEAFLKYVIATIIIDQDLQLGDLHKSKSIGCPNDYCDEVVEVNMGMKAGDYCTKCKKFFHNAIERGAITIQQHAAIYRILDHVCNRRVSFVIMPYAKKFDRVYSIVKDILAARGYTCLIGRDIIQSREVMTIVYEMIERAEVMIVDMSDLNANVFYELGYAHAKNKNTILISQKGQKIPFNLSHRQVAQYSKSKNMRESLEKVLVGYL